MRANLRERRPFGDIGNKIQGEQCKILDAKKRSHSLESSPRFDAKNKHIPVLAAEYAKDIQENFRKMELKFRPSSTYMSRLQTEVTEKMRTILVDWIVDVHLKFKQLPETLFLAVEIIDRYLDKKAVCRQRLQLVGVVAMLLASKYEEIYPPEVRDYIFISANTYTREDVLRMERQIFQTLDFNLTFPTIFPFLKRGLQVMEADTRTQQLSQYLAELSLLDVRMLAYSPSVVASSCIYLSNKFLSKEPAWSRVLEHYSFLKLTDLEKCCSDLLSIFRNSHSQKTQAVRRKYSYSKYGEVSKMNLNENVTLP